MRYEVMCTVKDSKYERIRSLGCKDETGAYHRFTEDEVLKRLRAGDEFHVTRGGRTVKLIEAEHEGRPYVKTETDGFRPDNLLALPHCVEETKPVAPPVRTVPAHSHSV
jgi:hypothetical protein